MNNVKIFEAFSGIGAQYKALKNISKEMNWNVKHTGMIEWFIDAIISYVVIHKNNDLKANKEPLFNLDIDISKDSKNKCHKNYVKKKINNSLVSFYINYSKKHFNNLFDIKSVLPKDLPKDIDIFTYSFPCQDLSLQGLQKGMNKNSNTKSSLLWEIERILKGIKDINGDNCLPKYLLMENVPSIINKRNIKNFNLWLEQLNDIGYVSKIYLLNAKDYGIPQNRERVFCLSVRKSFKEQVGFEFSKITNKSNSKSLEQIIDIKDNTDLIDFSNYKFSNWKTFRNGVVKKQIHNYTKFKSENWIYSTKGIGPTLTAQGANNRIKFELNNNVRYIKAKESLLYMGFDEQEYQLIKNTNLLNDRKIKFLSGNSICINVLENIFRTLKF